MSDTPAIEKTEGRVRAVLIDPETRTITEVEIDGSLRSFYRQIGCDTVALGTIFPNGDVLYVDDNGLLNGPKHFFKISIEGNTFAGKGLIVGPEVEDDSPDGYHVVDAQTRAAYLGVWWMASVSEVHA